MQASLTLPSLKRYFDLTKEFNSIRLFLTDYFCAWQSKNDSLCPRLSK